MAFNMMNNDNRVIPYPRGKAIEVDVVMAWFDDVMKGKVEPMSGGFEKEVKDTMIKGLLNIT
jgi:hypothetical protein